MRWNGRGEVVCPLRGQSLESRLAAQRSVERAVGPTGCGPESRRSEASGGVSWLGQMQRISMGGTDQVSQQLGASRGTRPGMFPDQLGQISAGSSPSTLSRLGPIGRRKNRGFSIGTPTFGEARPSNNALHLTKVATNGLAPFAGERECWADQGPTGREV